MVEGVRDVVKTIARFQPGESRIPIEKDLLSKFTALCEDTLIELQYSLLLITNEVLLHWCICCFTRLLSCQLVLSAITARGSAVAACHRSACMPLAKFDRA